MRRRSSSTCEQLTNKLHIHDEAEDQHKLGRRILRNGSFITLLNVNLSLRHEKRCVREWERSYKRR
jgi:hypothetical protein